MSRVSVISGPAAAVSAADAKAAGVFSSDDADALVTLMLAAAQGTIDGPDGWLGRAVGLQTLELSTAGDLGCVRWPDRIKLPYIPIRSITSVKSVATDGTETTIDPSGYSLAGDVVTFADPLSRNALRIRYVAGYGPVSGGSDLPLPAPIKHAIMLMAAQLQAISPASEGDIVKEDITGVGSTVYATAKASEDSLRTTAERLLSTFRIYL